LLDEVLLLGSHSILHIFIVALTLVENIVHRPIYRVKGNWRHFAMCTIVFNMLYRILRFSQDKHRISQNQCKSDE